MDDTDSTKSRTALQEQAADWLLRGEHNVMVTLTFSGSDGVSYKFAEKAFGTFAHKLKGYLFGTKSKKRIAMCPIVEDYGAEMMWSTSPTGVRQGTHIHCLMRLPGSPMNHKDVVRRLWRASGRRCGDPRVNCPGRDDWYVEMLAQQDRVELTSYALKKCSDSVDGVLVKFVPVRATT
ncbi:hypothetical protein [Stenotrophomonas maltophilia]|uniref:hypothetical protein n=1 Tax=Stenotrophomonas maltophilia TaxID=40324 RepID=UPI0015DE695F|nr:hypothetical protein [Stenotrophomonas maltophilia]MBA0283706.1 hypothetical protein [Stenotrophomonas maltophilia]MBA0325722.1 hypothetical protein [Stenotrophomonas maltophilia]